MPKAKSSISGSDLARVVARLQRGWLGVFVTTAVFSDQSQLELIEDKYPIVLINGRRLAQELQQITVAEGVSLQELFDRETAWYMAHQQPFPPARILDDSVFASAASAQELVKAAAVRTSQ